MSERVRVREREGERERRVKARVSTGFDHDHLRVLRIFFCQPYRRIPLRVGTNVLRHQHQLQT